MKTKKEEIIEILKYEAHLQETTDYTNYEIENIHEIAEKIVKLFSMSDVVEAPSEQFYCAANGRFGTGNCERQCDECEYSDRKQ